ncbi:MULTISPECIES: site-specific integrase [unclassified Lysinibacillus]|uniref:tyrosine-type recombinase/integrase n=1 Tax=unclassified Lysinibacillus TaxID=2636778 RepID=UPI000884F2E3|nr:MULTISPECIES: site-specific integrase [unclassified Lysinibacillus]SCY51937.1 Phage integrase family protein [Lysinibacillus sp. SG9]SDB22664.1 Phage integrase family protein [Lysinibacillus sp. TC-37]SFS71834.1 Phage integrase family protein [Lysinibacillus sp. SG55]
MELKTKIFSPSDNLVMQKIKTVDIYTFKETDYKTMFDGFKKVGLISGEYNADFWNVFDELQDMPIEISFNIKNNKLLEKYLKHFTLLRLQNSKKPRTVYNEVYNLKKCIINSDGLKSQTKLELFLSEEYSKSKHHGGNLASDLKLFLSFIQPKDIEELKKVCGKFPIVNFLNRELPNLHDILKFDEILNDYFKTHDSDTTFRYLPIMLWWLITNIIPQRPSEFLKLQKDCLEIAQIDGEDKYFIKVHRIKSENTIDSLEIDKLTFNLIKSNMQKITTRLKNDTHYLFTIDFYYLGKTRKYSRKKSNERLNRRDFYALLNDFYKEVVEGLYKVNRIEKIRFGDTRHFAIINMCLQGFNMLSVANMAGHKSIYTQNEYFSHAKQFATSYVYLMAQKNLEFTFSKNFSNGLVGWKEFVYDKGKSISIKDLNSEDVVGPIEYGVCVELKKAFPKHCITDCRFCPKFYFKPIISEYDEGLDWLINGSSFMKDKIENAIDFMKDIVTNSINNNNRAAQNSLQTTSRNLVNYMDLKAIVDMKIMESDKNHEF